MQRGREEAAIDQYSAVEAYVLGDGPSHWVRHTTVFLTEARLMTYLLVA